MTKLCRASAGLILGFVLFLLLPSAPAFANPGVTVNGGQDATVSGTASIGWSATLDNNCSVSSVSATVAGPGTGGNAVPLSTQQSTSGTVSWDTTSPTGATKNYNGTYTLTVTVQEGGFLCGSHAGHGTINVYINNRPGTPSWNGSPTATTQNGAPAVSLSWTYPNPEPDLREFAILRVAPDGSIVQADVSSSNPAKQGCAVNGSTYNCTDTAFPSSGYGGQYKYSIVALRYTTAGSVTSYCQLDASGNPYNGAPADRCVSSPSPWPTEDVTLDEPSPSPSPTDSSGGSPSPTTSPGTVGASGGSSGTRTPSTAQVGGVKKQQGSLPGEGSNWADFYTGTYSTQLPYQDRTLLLPFDQKAPTTGNKAVETVKNITRPLALSLKNRAVLLPLAGGLLLFLGAAHVRRLLADR